MTQLTFLDLCSGIGGFRLGLESAGHKCVGYCEYDKFARASYEAMYDTEGEWKADDVTKLKPSDVPRADIWCFGFPCQDISVAGKQRGLVGKRSGIYFNIIDLLKGKEESDKPTYLFVENVKNLLSINAGFDFATVLSLMAEAAGVKEEDILGHDLFLYNRQPGTIWGADETFLSCGRLDDLQCAFSSVKAVIEGENSSSVSVAAIFDNEEVGSGTKQGADSTFLKDVLERINDSLGRTREQYLMAVASSFMISADNAHAVHPNHADVADPTNRPSINEGIVIKYNANQKYTTDAVSAAVFKALCKKVQVPVQTFTNRSDIAGGSTLGNISNAHVSLNTVDIGLPQFAMHSPYETAGVKDTCYLIKAATEFFNSCIVAEGNGNYTLGE